MFRENRQLIATLGISPCKYTPRNSNIVREYHAHKIPGTAPSHRAPRLKNTTAVKGKLVVALLPPEKLGFSVFKRFLSLSVTCKCFDNVQGGAFKRI